MKTKCKFKYFMQGFLHPFGLPDYKYCPYCCSKISTEEYNFELTFRLGCRYCRDKDIEEEYLVSGFTERVLTEMEDRLDELGNESG